MRLNLSYTSPKLHDIFVRTSWQGKIVTEQEHHWYVLVQKMHCKRSTGWHPSTSAVKNLPYSFLCLGVVHWPPVHFFFACYFSLKNIHWIWCSISCFSFFFLWSVHYMQTIFIMYVSACVPSPCPHWWSTEKVFKLSFRFFSIQISPLLQCRENVKTCLL